MNYEAFLKYEKSALFGALYNDLTATIVTALRADTVIHDGSTAIRANAEGRNSRVVMRSSLVSSLLGDFVFRMCHCLSFLIVIIH